MPEMNSSPFKNNCMISWVYLAAIESSHHALPLMGNLKIPPMPSLDHGRDFATGMWNFR